MARQSILKTISTTLLSLAGMRSNKKETRTWERHWCVYERPSKIKRASMYEDNSMAPGTVVVKNLRRNTSVVERNIMGKSKNMAPKAMPRVNFCTIDLNRTIIMLTIKEGSTTG
jgi:hypothetical protein